MCECTIYTKGVKKYLGHRLKHYADKTELNPLNAELNPIRHLLALVGATISSTIAG
jgi:hypothetical protein